MRGISKSGPRDHRGRRIASSWPGIRCSGAAVLLAALCLALLAVSAQAESVRGRALVDAWIDGHIDDVVAVYRHLHAHPELSMVETETAALVARALEAAGYAVTSGVGGTGVVGVLANGPGPVVLVRGDMDALPLTEATGLPYASRVRVELPDGRESGVMHACGHDVHTANLTAVARLLAEHREAWSGTLVVVAQPGEEIGAGALAMIEDGLFERFPRPDYALALHVESGLPAGDVGFTPGWAMANVDGVDVVFHGRSGHGARPHKAVDPILAAAHFVTAVQSVVSRRVDPQDPAVITVGVFHAGTKRNLIPDEARLELTVRSYGDDVRAQLLDGIRQIAEDTCRTFQCTAPPDVSTREHYTPALYNDPALNRRAVELFQEAFGEDHVVERPPSMGGEDFGRYARLLEVPGLMFRVGTQPRKRFEASQEPGAEPLPSVHASDFAPDADPTLETAIRAMSLLALDLLAVPEAPR